MWRYGRTFPLDVTVADAVAMSSNELRNPGLGGLPPFSVGVCRPKPGPLALNNIGDIVISGMLISKFL